MKRVLCIVGGMNAGGAETFLMKVYRRLDKNKYQMDFAVANDGCYDEEIRLMGGKIFKITPKSQGFLKNFLSVKKLVKNEGYKYVLRTSQHSLSAMELLAARLGGAKKLIYRSSNSNTIDGSKKGLLLHKLCGFMPIFFANVRIAPSTEAAEFMFGKDCVKKGKATILNNGIDMRIFNYNGQNRNECREEFKLKNKFVVGHIGRFSAQKNHDFLLEIFAEIKKKKEDSILLIVGGGELEAEIKQKAKELNVFDNIVFTGVRSDVSKLLSAMDVFVFPSFYEGMPNTVIEAQAEGLPCIISDTITKEADITGLVKYLPLDLSAEKWADEVIDCVSAERKETKDDFVKNGYDIDSVTDKFIQFVFGDK